MLWKRLHKICQSWLPRAPRKGELPLPQTTITEHQCTRRCSSIPWSLHLVTMSPYYAFLSLHLINENLSEFKISFQAFTDSVQSSSGGLYWQLFALTLGTVYSQRFPMRLRSESQAGQRNNQSTWTMNHSFTSSFTLFGE